MGSQRGPLDPGPIGPPLGPMGVPGDQKNYEINPGVIIMGPGPWGDDPWSIIHRRLSKNQKPNKSEISGYICPAKLPIYRPSG